METRPGLPHIESVLVPTDISELGARAVRYAYAFVQRGGVVHLLHVIPPTGVPSPLYAHYEPGHMPSAEEREEMRHKLEEAMSALVPHEVADIGVRTELHVREANSVPRAICEVADELDVDLICLSSHGRSGIARAVLGSVAEAVLEHSTRPVQVVREPKA